MNIPSPTQDPRGFLRALFDAAVASGPIHLTPVDEDE